MMMYNGNNDPLADCPFFLSHGNGVSANVNLTQLDQNDLPRILLNN